jgi:hypothetical protein
MPPIINGNEAKFGGTVLSNCSELKARCPSGKGKKSIKNRTMIQKRIRRYHKML